MPGWPRTPQIKTVVLPMLRQSHSLDADSRGQEDARVLYDAWRAPQIKTVAGPPD